VPDSECGNTSTRLFALSRWRCCCGSPVMVPEWCGLQSSTASNRVGMKRPHTNGQTVGLRIISPAESLYSPECEVLCLQPARRGEGGGGRGSIWMFFYTCKCCRLLYTALEAITFHNFASSWLVSSVSSKINTSTSNLNCTFQISH
jgi:hypothetical protein